MEINKTTEPFKQINPTVESIIDHFNYCLKTTSFHFVSTEKRLIIAYSHDFPTTQLDEAVFILIGRGHNVSHHLNSSAYGVFQAIELNP